VGKRALITGVTGQDGSYLTELLLSKGYEVHGIVRQSSLFNRDRLKAVYALNESTPLHLHYGDLIDSSNLNRILREVEPDEIYNLGAQSHVGISFEIPEYTADVDALGCLRLLDAVRASRSQARLYQASTSELFGDAAEVPQSEKTPFRPRSPYAAAKLYAFWATVNYREAYGMFAANGILFNHESPRRGENFVSRKITLSITQILKNEIPCLRLGNLDARRDWGYAPEYVEAMWLMLQQDRAHDLVIATNETHRVREFAEEAFRHVDIELEWRGSGAAEKGVDRKTGRVLVEVDPRYFRPTEVDLLQGDFSRARQILNWQPRIRFHELVRLMMAAELQRAGLQPSGGAHA
jgi:GDPmannose 4,6-dehydratase